MKGFALQVCLLTVGAVAACSSGGTGGSGGTSTTATSQGGGGSGTTTTSTTSSSTSSSSTTTTSSSSTTTTESGPCTTCTVVATLKAGAKPTGLDLDADNVFWTNSGTGEVMQAKKDGTSPIELNKGEDTPMAVHVAGGKAYWVSYSLTGVMRRAPVGGGAVQNLVEAPTARDLFVGTSTIWWTREPDDIQSIPIDGIDDAAAAGLLTGNPLSQGIAYDGTSLFWANKQDGYIKRADPDLSNETPLAIGTVPYEIAVDGTSVYWTESGSAPNTGKVMKASKADGTGAVALADAQDGPQALAIDGTNVYWANKTAGTVCKVPIAGGTVTILAKDQGQPWDIAVDATHVYWTNYTGDSVLKTAK